MQATPVIPREVKTAYFFQINNYNDSTGPAVFALFADSPCTERSYNCFSDFFRPKSSNNKLVKYADDTNLLVPENTNCTLLEEFEHVKDWARANKLVINMSKTKELVFHKPRPTRFQMPEVVDDIGVCVLEDMITSCPYVSIVFVKKTSFIPPMLINFFVIVNQCMVRFDVFPVFSNVCGCHLLFY